MIARALALLVLLAYAPAALADTVAPGATAAPAAGPMLRPGTGGPPAPMIRPGTGAPRVVTLPSRGPSMRAVVPSGGLPAAGSGLIRRETPLQPLVIIGHGGDLGAEVASAKVEEVIRGSKALRLFVNAERRTALAACGDPVTRAAALATAAPGTAGAPGTATTPVAAPPTTPAPDENPDRALVRCLVAASASLTRLPGDEPHKILWLDVRSSRSGRDHSEYVRALFIDRATGGVDRWAEAGAEVERAAGAPDDAPDSLAAAPGDRDVQIAIQKAAASAARKVLGEFALMDVLDSLPLIMLVLVALLVLLADAFVAGGAHAHAHPTGRVGAKFAVYISLAGLVATLAMILARWNYVGAPAPRLLFGGAGTGGPMMVLDRFGLFFDLVLVLSGVVGVLLIHGYHRIHGADRGERYSLTLFAIAGMMVLASATDLVTQFLGLETMSLAIYVLVASNRAQKESAEAGMKYFLIGSVASGILVYGIALLYGAFATTRLTVIAAAVSSTPALAESPLALAGVLLVVAAFGFKVAAVPFHAWLPDAYQGAPTPITGFMSVAVKAAAFAAFARVLAVGFGGLHGAEAAAATVTEGIAGAMEAARSHGWYGPLQLAAVLTMILGNAAAIPQRNVKRMLAYSGIAHAGYLLIGLCAIISIAGTDAAAAIEYYLLAYGAANLGAFAVIVAVGRAGDERLDVDLWAGLGRRKPLVALAMTICMASLVGIPPTAGFFAKFYLFKAAVGAGLVNLAVLGVVTSVAGVYYYLRIVVSMYMKEAPVEAPGASPAPPGAEHTSPATYIALALAIAGILYLGILPDHAIELATEGARALLGK